MLFKVEKNYLVLPVSCHAKMKKLSFYGGDKDCILRLDLRLDALTPQYDAYIDVRRFKGETLEVSANPEISFPLKCRDRMPVCRFREKMRPKYHFTAPEGLFENIGAVLYTGGAYHLFYNLNPISNESGNTHTGHAVSKNLVDWEYCTPSLFPDKDGNVSVSGAVLDEKNLLSAKTCEKIPAVLLYDYDSAKGSHIAVSDDGCESFLKLTFMPPVECTGSGKPSLIYSEKLDKYVMASAASEGKCEIFASKNLRDFQKCCEIPFDTGKNPSFFPVKVSGNEEKWVLFGKDDKYIIGEFNGKSFNADFSGVHPFNYSENPVLRSVYFESATHDRVLRATLFDGSFSYPGDNYCGVMAFPQEMSILKTDEGERIYVSPAREIEKLHGKKVKKIVTGRENVLTLRGIAQDISITLSPLSAKNATISVFGIPIELDFSEMRAKCGICTCPITVGEDGKTELRILTDTCGFEIYLDNGASYMAIREIPDANLCALSLTADSEILAKVCAVRLRDSRRSDRRR